MGEDSIVEYTMLVAYLALLMWIGLRAARRVRCSEDFTVAGRDVPWLVILATTAATMIGGGASVGYVARVSQIGIAAANVTCAWHLQLIFTGWFVAPKLRGLNLITVGDFFHLRFGPLARELAVVNCVIFLIGALAAQMAAIGTIANTVLDLDYRTALLIGAAVTIFYSTVGGIRAVISTDVLQFVILVIGLGVAAAYLLSSHGGFDEMAKTAQDGQFHPTSHPEWPAIRVFSVFFAFLLGETFVPPYAVRCFIARDSRQARWGVAGAGIFLLLFLPIVTVTLGTSAQISPAVQQAIQKEKERILAADREAGKEVTEQRAAQAEGQARQIAFPALVRTTFHPVFVGIVIAAIIAAVMSSGDSCLSCLSTAFMEDVYRRHINPEASDKSLLRVAQVTTLVSGVAATACAWFVRDIGSILEFVYDFWAPTMVLPFMVALFWYHERRIYAAVASMVAGGVSAVAWRMADSPFGVTPALFAFAAALLAYLVALPLTKNIPLTSWFKPGK